MTSLMINDPIVAGEPIAQRKARRADRFDEVWDGVSMMSPITNTEHPGSDSPARLKPVTVNSFSQLVRIELQTLPLTFHLTDNPKTIEVGRPGDEVIRAITL